MIECHGILLGANVYQLISDPFRRSNRVPETIIFKPLRVDLIAVYKLSRRAVEHRLCTFVDILRHGFGILRSEGRSGESGK